MQALLFLLISLAILVFSAQLAVKGLTKVARSFHVSEFFVAFFILAFCTSLPELFVGISSALEGNPALSLGNVIGSNIVNITLIAGLGVLIAQGYHVRTAEVRKQSYLMLAAYILPVILMWMGDGLSRLDGVILLLFFAGYLIHNLLHHENKQYEGTITPLEKMLSPVLFLLSLAVLIMSARFVVQYAEIIALQAQIPSLLIGLILVALGTSLPELSFAITAFLHHRGELSLGGLVGAGIVNASLILGITALIHPITTDMTLFKISSIFMLLSGGLFTLFMATKHELSVKEGVILILVYVGFIVTQLFLPLL